MSSSIRTTRSRDGRLVATTSVAFAEILARLAPGSASMRLNSAAESGPCQPKMLWVKMLPRVQLVAAQTAAPTATASGGTAPDRSAAVQGC